MKKVLLATAIASAAMLTACGGGSSGVAADVSPDVQMAVGVQMETLGTVDSVNNYQSPAAIRTRYGFDPLVATPESQGSGQLIAIVSAYNNPDLAENLRVFSARYNLPQCDVVPTVYTQQASGYYSANVSKPTVGANCTIQVVNLDSFGRANPNKLPTSPATWTSESTMDIQWAHAVAPSASILVVQTASDFADAMGYGAKYASETALADVVSMSWGQKEGSIICPRKPGTTIQYDPACSDAETAKKFWTARTHLFTGSAAFVAASGDSGVPQWPSINPNIMAVGGTVFSSNMPDTGWANSGGGLSVSFNATPAQAFVTKQTRRAIPDVAYDAGTRVAVYIKPNAATGKPDSTCVANFGADKCGWYAGTGTSIGAPQWAGLIAIANATRISNNKASINFLDTLYTDIAVVPGTYATSFKDVTYGNTIYNKTAVGYDMVTGLGVPNAGVLVNYLAAK